MRNWFIKRLSALRMAIGLFTVAPGFARWDDGLVGLLAPLFPIVGALLGGAWAGIAALAQGFPGLLGAATLSVTLPVMTGFLHADGFIDVCDALLSRRPREEKLRILKDPHAGALGTISFMCLALLLMGAADGFFASGRSALGLWPLPVAARAPVALLMMRGTPLPGSEYGKALRNAATRGGRIFVLFIWAAALVLASCMGALSGLAYLFASAAACLAWYVAVSGLGGMNGDVAGFAVCVGGCAGLIALAA